jgi:hypothetical protein
VSARLPGERIAGLVYGTIVVMGVIAASSSVAQGGAFKIATLVIATTVVLWLAHVYAHSLQVSLTRGERLTAGGIGDVAVHESAILSAAVLPTAALLLGGFEVISDRAATWIALGAGTGVLAAQAIAYARIERLGRLATLTIVVVNLVLGLAIVGLKAAVSH